MGTKVLAEARSNYHTDASAAAQDAKAIRQINADIKKTGHLLSTDQQNQLSQRWKSFASNAQKAGADLADINGATGKGNTADKGEVTHDVNYLEDLRKYAVKDTQDIVDQWHDATGTDGIIHGVNGDRMVPEDVGTSQTSASLAVSNAFNLSKDKDKNPEGAQADATRDTVPNP